MNFIITQHRDHRTTANVSDRIKYRLLSEFGEGYHKILAIMSKIFDDNPQVSHLDIIFCIDGRDIVIRSAIINNDHFSNVSPQFTRNGFRYEAL